MPASGLLPHGPRRADAVSTMASLSGIRPTSRAEPRKDTASDQHGNGAVKAWTSAPPRAGPATLDADWLTLSLLLAST